MPMKRMLLITTVYISKVHTSSSNMRFFILTVLKSHQALDLAVRTLGLSNSLPTRKIHPIIDYWDIHKYTGLTTQDMEEVQNNLLRSLDSWLMSTNPR